MDKLITSTYQKQSDSLQENSLKQLGERIRTTREQKLKLPRNALADILNVSLTTLQNYEYGKRDPNTSFMIHLAAVAEINLNWLITGIHPDRDLDSHVYDRYALIPKISHTNEAERFTDKYAIFCKDWIKNHLQVEADNLILMSIEDDSMKGIIEEQDDVLINLADNKPINGLYALEMNQGKMVKHIQTLPAGILRISSNNHLYLPFDISINDLGGDISILGKVIWTSRKL